MTLARWCNKRFMVSFNKARIFKRAKTSSKM